MAGVNGIVSTVQKWFGAPSSSDVTRAQDRPLLPDTIQVSAAAKDAAKHRKVVITQRVLQAMIKETWSRSQGQVNDQPKGLLESFFAPKDTVGPEVKVTNEDGYSVTIQKIKDGWAIGSSEGDYQIQALVNSLGAFKEGPNFDLQTKVVQENVNRFLADEETRGMVPNFDADWDTGKIPLVG